MAADLAQYGTALTSTLRQHFAALNELSVFVQSLPYAASDPALANEFEIFAAGLYSGEVGVRYFAGAPGGIQQYVYPVTGNESALGRDLLSGEQPGVQAEVQRALDSRQMTVSSQPGSNASALELTARLAVYRGDDFWGLVTMGLDVAPLLREAGLDTHPPDLDLALRTRTDHIFYGQSTVFDSETMDLANTLERRSTIFTVG